MSSTFLLLRSDRQYWVSGPMNPFYHLHAAFILNIADCTPVHPLAIIYMGSYGQLLQACMKDI